MQTFKIDLTYKEVDAPQTLWCRSGHTAGEEFRREGADKPPEPTKFFRVTGQGLDIIVCEPCLMIANYIAQQNKKKT